MHLPQSKNVSNQNTVSIYEALPCEQILNASVTALRFKPAMGTIMQWAHRKESRAVCVANVHMLMESYWHPKFSQVLQKADMVTPDGMPLVWMMKLLGRERQDRVAGMDILQSLCQQASEQNIKVFFLGSQQAILDRMRTRLEQEYPHLDIAAMKPLPFRPLTLQEDQELIEEIHASGAGLVFLSLGCPKQEKWMAEHQGQVQAVMIGLGGAFPVYAGLKKWAPRWVRQAGLEWLYRLIQEPRRLIGRYSQTIPPFMLLSLAQLLSHYFSPRRVLSAFKL
ncbi:WecB/TagA/CpsF family glycosyltransferase [Acaryochloris sp. IP29b_bin.137]|uniref:WecB/TagA/CpsF family glycosyltransferase n=1 Tax=Acaryochloris sp. IP29b_bin.137 TaxID=2969217 RepID=UPI00344DF5B6